MQWTGVCQCVCLFHRLDCAAATAGLLLSAVQAGRTRRSTMAGTSVQHQRRRSMELSSKRGQCHDDSRGTRLSTDLTTTT